MSPRLESLTHLVERRLTRALPHSSRTPSVIHKAMRYCVFSGGKRFRPLLCLGGCEAVGGDIAQALDVACAVECIHTYSLVHDDLPAMDDAAVRRGRPSCHRAFGEATAILVGDALLTLAFAQLARNGTSNALAIIRTLSEASGTAGLVGGQVLDLAMTSRQKHRNTAPGAAQLRAIARRKTGALMTASVVSGGLAGEGHPEAIRRLSRYGQQVGLAFQLLDDAQDHDGLATRLGMNETRQEAGRLLRGALRSLAPFGQRGKTLRHLAEWLAQMGGVAHERA